MLNMEYECSGCGASGKVENTSVICGQCPKCGRHHGEVEYSTNMSVRDFLETLTNSDENYIAKNAYAIQLCAELLMDKA